MIVDTMIGCQNKKDVGFPFTKVVDEVACLSLATTSCYLSSKNSTISTMLSVSLVPNMPHNKKVGIICWGLLTPNSNN